MNKADSSTLDTMSEPDEMDLDISDVLSVIDVRAIETKLEERGSVNVADAIAHCKAENETIVAIRRLLYDRLDALEIDGVAPPALVACSTDAWLHVIETISDYIDAIERKAKHCRGVSRGGFMTS